MQGQTDYHADPNSQYDAFAKASAVWYDDDFCHPLLFRPDFDFETWGNPIEAQ